MKDDLKFWEMELDLNFWEKEDDLKFWEIDFLKIILWKTNPSAQAD